MSAYAYIGVTTLKHLIPSNGPTYGKNTGKIWQPNLSELFAFVGSFLWPFYGNNKFKSSVELFRSISVYKFSICSREIPKNLISMISEFLDVSSRPKTNIIYLWIPRVLQKIKKTPKLCSGDIMFEISKN